MVVFPHCKINLGLHVLRRRDDGFHDLETAFYPLPLKDVLEIIPVAKPQGEGVGEDSASSQRAVLEKDSASQQQALRDQPPGRFLAMGLPIPGDADNNLCTRAWRLLKNDFSDLPAVDTWLYKNIPMGAGLGGGSSDGARMLLALDRHFRLELGRERLAAYALQLGSDCAFFLYDQPCFATGRGETLEPIALDLSDYFIVLVYPGVHISTGSAFAELQPAMPETPLKEILGGPVSDWRSTLVNVFEGPVFRQYPELREIKEQLYRCGAVYASMTGSGSAFYGLFPRGPGRTAGMQTGGTMHNLPDASQFPGYFFKVL
jgi:4-diphosphocytidyl-2-C-methyl-D-erythritol kinase